MLAEVNRDAGISLRASYDMMKTLAGGRAESLGFTKSDLKNLLANKRRSIKMKGGEGNLIMKYLGDQLKKNSNFFHDVEVDEENRISNIFWADAQMRIDYSVFGDCISFDTTYHTDAEYRPLRMYKFSLLYILKYTI